MTIRRWSALGVLTLGVLLIGVDGTVVSLATPFIVTGLGAGATDVLWVGDIYSFVLAGLLVTMGSLGDRVGHRKLLLWGAIGFGAAHAGLQRQLLEHRLPTRLLRRQRLHREREPRVPVVEQSRPLHPRPNLGL